MSLNLAPVDPAFADLRREMAEVGAEPAMVRGLAEQDAQEADGEADRCFGATLLAVVAEKHGADLARQLRDALTKGTRPGTRERAFQDRAFGLITARLEKLAGEQAS